MKLNVLILEMSCSMWSNLDLIALTGRIEEHYISGFVLICLCCLCEKKNVLIWVKNRFFFFMLYDSFGFVWPCQHDKMPALSTLKHLPVQSKFKHFYIFLHIVYV